MSVRTYAAKRKGPPLQGPNEPDGLVTRHRPMPSSAEMERAVLASMIMEERAILVASEVLTPADFYRPDHGRIFALILGMYGKGEPVEVVALGERLLRLPPDEQEAHGGYGYVLGLLDAVPSSVAINHYASTVKALSDRRRLLTTLANRVEVVYDDATVDALDHRDRAVADLLSISREHGGGWKSYDKVADRLDATIAEGEALGGDRPRGVPLGFRGIDDKFGTMLPGNLVILAARPAMGKTALALDVAEFVSREIGAVGFFSLEMDEQELQARSVAKRAMLSARRILEGRIVGYEEAIDRGLYEVRKLPIYVDDRPRVTVGEIRARARGLKAAAPDLALIVVDYLQLIVDADPMKKREQVVADAARGLKAIAKELQVPVLALAQLNRQLSDRKDPRPILTDLRESGEIEQAADKVYALHRHRYYYPDDTKIPADAAELLCLKNRNGQAGTGDLQWLAEQTTFRDEVRQAVLMGRGGRA